MKVAAASLEQSLDTSSMIEDGGNNVSTPDSQILMPLSTQDQVKTPEDNHIVLVDYSESNKVNEVAQLKSESNKFNEVAQLKASLDTQEEYNPKLVDKSESNKIELTESTELLIERKVDVENNDDVESGSTQMERPPLKNSNQGKKKPALSSSRSLTYGKAAKLPSPPAKKTTLIHPKKENVATSINKKPVKDSVDKRRMTPKSLHKSLYLTPAREVNRLASSVIRKIDSSRVGSKDCSTSLKTPATASKSGVPKQPLSTRLSENRRDGVPLESLTSRSKTVRAKWHFLPTFCSKFLSACKIKPQSPCFSTFNFRTEERAAKRKEKLKEKFNANQAQKVKPQETLKGHPSQAHDQYVSFGKFLSESLDWVKWSSFSSNQSTDFVIERKAGVDIKVNMESEVAQMEKHQLKSSNQDCEVLMSKKKPAISSSRSLAYGKAAKLPSSLAKKTALIHPKKENIATSIN